jgi:hypothetical protein
MAEIKAIGQPDMNVRSGRRGLDNNP